MKTIAFTQITPIELEGLIENSLKKILRVQEQSRSAQDQILSVQQTADLLKLTKPTIYSKASRGELPYHKRGKQLYFFRNELMDYIKKGRVKTNAEIEAEAGNSLINKKGVNHGK